MNGSGLLRNALTVANALYESGLCRWAHPNFVASRSPRFVPNDPQYQNQWHLNNTGQSGGTRGADVRAEEAWEITTGSPDVSIAVEDEKLVLRMEPAPAFVADLEHWHYNTFRIHWRESVNYDFPPGFVTFAIDGAGKTDQLTIDQPNNDFWFYELKLRRAGKE